MRFALAMFCLFACGASALAQAGVSNQRDMYGNIVRDTGRYPARGVNRGPINNGPISSRRPSHRRAILARTGSVWVANVTPQRPTTRSYFFQVLRKR